MNVSITIQLESGDKAPKADDVGKKLVKALGLNTDKDSVTIFVNQAPETATIQPTPATAPEDEPAPK